MSLAARLVIIYRNVVLWLPHGRLVGFSIQGLSLESVFARRELSHNSPAHRGKQIYFKLWPACLKPCRQRHVERQPLLDGSRIQPSCRCRARVFVHVFTRIARYTNRSGAMISWSRSLCSYNKPNEFSEICARAEYPLAPESSSATFDQDAPSSLLCQSVM